MIGKACRRQSSLKASLQEGVAFKQRGVFTSSIPRGKGPIEGAMILVSTKARFDSSGVWGFSSLMAIITQNLDSVKHIVSDKRLVPSFLSLRVRVPVPRPPAAGRCLFVSKANGQLVVAI